ncbi:MAG TPA: AGE family epimerase/isomerase [Terriglobales bacterium]|nr:AGE family epimerase/isomerase [Terriglobales bacterium]
MTTIDRLSALGVAAEKELREGILPFWAVRAVDRDQGGFFGRIGADGRPDPGAGKGGVLNARILWTFSAALRRWPDPLYRSLADRAFGYLLEHFWDSEHSGLYWEVDNAGRMLQGRKQTYGQAFGIYGLAEYFRATGVQEALDRADRLFEDVEARALDPVSGGYWEARGRNWKPIDDIRLSTIDLNAPFSMNTHVHLLEAYTGLVLASDGPRHRDRLRAVLEIILDRIIDAQTGHLILFQDEQWQPMSSVVSHGHEIETSWLLCEAADALADEALSARARAAAVRLADGVMKRGYDAANGGILYEESPDGRVDTNKEWWGQAEGVVGLLNAFELSGRDEFLEAALRTWDFINAHVIDRVVGEWYTRVTREGDPIPGFAKVDFWKCPYHNARAMLEIAERTRKLATREQR